ncbi:MAG TPA: branched-chain amino acid ABC transporter permease [Burkholderiaceae bacterium]|nr:branched-chain amino acid ABC transporter permease [Burkholderiaceae bacterium]
MNGRWTRAALLVAAAALLAAAPLAPQWLVFLLTLALAKGLLVLGLLLLMRTGLVSFGQGLFFGLGAYGAALLSARAGISDAIAMIAVSIVTAAAVAALLGLLVARYREIFFAMLSLAFSMILYGVLVKSSALGSTDGFNLHAATYAGIAIDAAAGRRVIFGIAIVAFVGAAWAVNRLLESHFGLLCTAIRDNELRVEYLGASVFRVVYLNYVIAGALGGLGGALAALAVGHVDPETTYWTTSGEFVFIAILAGTGNVIAPFVAAGVFEVVRTFANQYAPNVWQMTLGIVMLLLIMFLPRGLAGLAAARAPAAGAADDGAARSGPAARDDAGLRPAPKGAPR